LEPSERLSRAVELVRADLEVGGATGFRLSPVRESGDDEFWVVYVGQRGQGSGFGVPVEGESFASLLVIVADRLQDVYIDLLWEARPRCPLHAHPLVAREHDGESAWVCPAESGWKRPIGSLAGDYGYVAAIEQPPGL
jgi:hypothetical protein